ncbi:MAG: 4Fe-4S binding protein [Eubacteriales bacterium]
MLRKVIEINEDKCVGCGLCANACHQSAIKIINGKAKLVSDSYCDGLGMCLPECPTDAISLVEKDTDEFKEERRNIKDKMENKSQGHGGGCPGTRAAAINRKATEEVKKEENNVNESDVPSQLNQWPVQIHLVSPRAPYLENADLLIAADCTAFAYGNIHNDFIKGRITLIGCPKLDDNNAYKEKFKEIMTNNNIKSITVLRMEVPCCGGIVTSVKQAMLESETIVPYNEVIIGVDGSKK